MAANGISSGSSAELILSQRDVMVIVSFLIIVALIIVLQPVILSITYRKQLNPSTNNTKGSARSFFETPYVMWFLVHNGMAALAMIVILILGLDSVLDRTTTAALLGSLFGYVLGSSSKHSQSDGQDGKSGTGHGKIDKPNVISDPNAAPDSPYMLTLKLDESDQVRWQEMVENARKLDSSKSDNSES
jgi:hypothetical protein